MQKNKQQVFLSDSWLRHVSYWDNQENSASNPELSHNKIICFSSLHFIDKYVFPIFLECLSYDMSKYLLLLCYIKQLTDFIQQIVRGFPQKAWGNLTYGTILQFIDMLRW